MSEVQRFGVELEQQEGFEFRVSFDWPGVAALTLDEPEPLGKRRGPNAAPHGRCRGGELPRGEPGVLPESKFRQNPGPVRAMATGRLERNERGRYRIAGIDVVLSLSEKLGDIRSFHVPSSAGESNLLDAAPSLLMQVNASKAAAP
jgi:hypothetical protein